MFSFGRTKDDIDRTRVYLDFAAATPVDPMVQRAMEPFWAEHFGNSVSSHKEGRYAEKVIEEARERCARVLHGRSSEIIFTSGGTESNNLALFGVVLECEKQGKKEEDMHIVSDPIEHSSVLEGLEELSRRGLSVSFVSVDAEGFIDPEDVSKALTEKTVLVSVMLVNNEIGTVEPVAEIGRLIRAYKRNLGRSELDYPYFHTDATQAPLYLSIDVEELKIDLLTLDAQKVYGPKGVGLLYRKSNVPLAPLFFGGGQERSFRSGTTATPLVVGFAEALVLAEARREKECARLIRLRDYFIEKLLREVPGAKLNGPREGRIAGNVNISVPGFEGDFLVIALDERGIAVGSKSACMGRTIDASYVLEALGKSSERARSSVRFSLGRRTTSSDLDQAVIALADIVARFRVPEPAKT